MSRSKKLKRYSPSAGEVVVKLDCRHACPEALARPGPGCRRAGMTVLEIGGAMSPTAFFATRRAASRYWSRNAGRRGQDGGDVVEALHLNILRQNVLLVHLDTQESFHRRGVFGAIQALHRHVARGGILWDGHRACFPSRLRTTSISFCGGWGLPGGGIKCPRNLRRAFSQVLASSGAF